MHVFVQKTHAVSQETNLPWEQSLALGLPVAWAVFDLGAPWPAHVLKLGQEH